MQNIKEREKERKAWESANRAALTALRGSVRKNGIEVVFRCYQQSKEHAELTGDKSRAEACESALSLLREMQARNCTTRPRAEKSIEGFSRKEQAELNNYVRIRKESD